MAAAERRCFPPPWSFEEPEALHKSHVVASAYPILSVRPAHRIRVDNVDNFSQVSAATIETSPYFSGEFLNELGALIFTTYCLQFASSL